MKIKTITIMPGHPFPSGLSRDVLARFLHDNMKPYEDSIDDVKRGLDYALSLDPARGGFILLAEVDGRLKGALVSLRTGMGGYIPSNILLFVGVEVASRGLGIGGHLIKEATSICHGDIKLHVEYDNPAKRLYERLGFTSKYAEMRYEGGTNR